MKYEFNTPPAVVTYGKAEKAKYFAKKIILMKCEDFGAIGVVAYVKP